MGKPVFSRLARQDVKEVLQWSRDRFGREAAKRYAGLLNRAFDELRADPLRIGSSGRAELDGVRSYPLRFSRQDVREMMVKAPRHVVFYRVREGRLEVLRVLDERRDLQGLRLLAE